MNIWDLLLRPKCTTVTNQVGRSQQLLLLLTVFTFTCSNGSNNRQLFDGCHLPTCPAAGTRELSAPLWMLIYLYRARLRRSYARPSTGGAALNTDQGVGGRPEDRARRPGLRNGGQTGRRDLFPVLIHVHSMARLPGVCGLLRGATRCQGGTGEARWATSALCRSSAVGEDGRSWCMR